MLFFIQLEADEVEELLLQDNDIVSVELDFNQGTLRWARNGQYFDANYTADQVKNSWMAIEKIIQNGKNAQLAEPIIHYKWKWYDMIGTKYLREEQLEKSIKTWKQIPEEYWYSEAWNYDDYLQANPFYANFYSRHFLFLCTKMIKNNEVSAL